MTYFSHAAVFIFTLSLVCGILSILIKTTSKPIKYTAFISFSYTLWAFGAFGFFSTSAEYHLFWQRIMAIGFQSLIWTIPFFFLSFRNVRIVLNKNMRFSIKAFFCGYATVLATITWFKPDFSQHPLAHYSIISFIVILSIALLITEKMYNKTKKFRIIFYISVVLIILLAVVYTSICLFPKLDFLQFNPLHYYWLSYFFILPISCLLFGMYRLSGKMTSAVIDALLESNSEMILVVDYPDILLKGNKKLLANFAFTPGVSSSAYLAKHKATEKAFAPFIGDFTKRSVKMVELTTDSGENILCNISLIPIIDYYNDLVGKVYVLQQMYDYQKQMDSFKLSPQEKKIVLQITNGSSNKDIADYMNLSENTVRNYLTNIYSKTNTANRVELLQLIFPTKKEI